MDQKRDSRSQRFKNLQYKSRGRGRRGQDVAPRDTEAEGLSTGEGENSSSGFSAANRLGSNWDRYAESNEANEEAGVADSSTEKTEKKTVKKQSEGLDYVALLEEADALLSKGGAYLLKRGDLDWAGNGSGEDPFLSDEPVEQPLPLGIDLSALNAALSSLSMAECLGVEDALFLTYLEEEGAQQVVPTSEEPGGARPEEASPQPASERSSQPGEVTVQRDYRKQEIKTAESVQQVGRGARSVLEGPSHTFGSQTEEDADSRRTGRSGRVGPMQPDDRLWTAQAEPSSISVCRDAASDRDGRGGLSEAGFMAGMEEASVLRAEVSTSGLERDEEADVLDLLLGGGDRVAAEGKPLPQRGDTGWLATGEERTRFRGQKEQLPHLPPVAKTPPNGLSSAGDGAGRLPLQTVVKVGPGDCAGSATDALNNLRGASVTNRESVPPLPQRPAQLVGEDDVDALLAALSSSVSKAEPAKAAAAANGTSTSGAGIGETVGFGASRRTDVPSEHAVRPAGLVGASRALESEWEPAEKKRNIVSNAPGPDQDFDDWLDSIT